MRLQVITGESEIRRQAFGAGGVTTGALNRMGIAARTILSRCGTTPASSGAGVTRNAYVLTLYQWADGDCFRCAARDLLTAPLGRILTPIGDVYRIGACQPCVLEMEEERRRHALRRGEKYRPGRLGSP